MAYFFNLQDLLKTLLSNEIEKVCNFNLPIRNVKKKTNDSNINLLHLLKGAWLKMAFLSGFTLESLGY